eukprot:2338345-Rhodomonas_salina.1
MFSCAAPTNVSTASENSTNSSRNVSLASENSTKSSGTSGTTAKKEHSFLRKWEAAPHPEIARLPPKMEAQPA